MRQRNLTRRCSPNRVSAHPLMVSQVLGGAKSSLSISTVVIRIVLEEQLLQALKRYLP